MRQSLVKAVESDAILSQFVRKGVEGGCIACRQPISDHVDRRGDWIGCQAPNLPNDIPFFLIPDRRLLGRRVTPEPRVRTNGHGQERRHEAEALPPTPAKKAAPRATSPVVRVSGPQVVYIARYPLTAGPVGRLPAHDRRVYGLIAKARKTGATRAALLEALGAQKRTGRIDGAVRRLRLRHVISVKSLGAPE